MESYEEQQTKQIVSKLNSGALINLRLNDLWREVQRHAKRGDYLNWNISLDVIWRELAGDEKENSDAEKRVVKIDEELWKTGKLFSQSNKGFVEFKPDDLKRMAKQYILLQKKEIFLRRLQNKQGKGTAYQDDSDDYMA